MNYTKGEWTVYESLFAPAVIIDGRKRNRPNRIIATCRLENGSEDMTEATANAHLIAASPLMYEALQIIRQFGIGRAELAIDKALAKAEGKSQ